MSVIESGALARTTQDVEIDGRRYRKGQQLIIEDYVSAEEADDGVAFYWGSTDGNYNNLWIHADRVELAKSAADMQKRMIPTAETMTEAERIARALHTITIQLGTGQWSLHEIRHILEGKQS